MGSASRRPGEGGYNVLLPGNEEPGALVCIFWVFNLCMDTGQTGVSTAAYGDHMSGGPRIDVGELNAQWRVPYRHISPGRRQRVKSSQEGNVVDRVCQITKQFQTDARAAANVINRTSITPMYRKVVLWTSHYL